MAKEEIQTKEVKVENKEGIEYADDEILTPENKAKLKKLIKTD